MDRFSRGSFAVGSCGLGRTFKMVLYVLSSSRFVCRCGFVSVRC